MIEIKLYSRNNDGTIDTKISVIFKNIIKAGNVIYHHLLKVIAKR